MIAPALRVIVCRHRLSGAGVEFTLVDTGGLEPLEPLRNTAKQALAEASVDFVHEIREQVEVAIADADVVIFHRGCSDRPYRSR